MKSLLIVFRELKAFVSDRADLVFSVALPVLLMLLMIAVFGNGDDFHPTAHLVDEDGKQYAERLTDELKQKVTTVKLTRSEALDRLDRAQIYQAVIIPSGFTENIQEGKDAQLVVKTRGAGGLEGQAVRSILRSLMAKMQTERAVRAEILQFADRMGFSSDSPQVSRYAEGFSMRIIERPSVGVGEVLVGEVHPSVVYILPGILTMFLLFTVTLNAQSLVRERKRGTLSRLIISGAGQFEIFVGRFFSQVLRGLLQVLVLFAVAEAFYSIFTVRSFLQSLLLTAVFLFSVSGFGLIIGSVFASRDSATWAAVFFTMAMSITGGAFYDTQAVGGAVAAISRFSLNHYANQGLEAILTGGSLVEIFPELAVLLSIFVLSFSGAWILFGSAVRGEME